MEPVEFPSFMITLCSFENLILSKYLIIHNNMSMLNL